jgi:hypothetical protein
VNDPPAGDAAPRYISGRVPASLHEEVRIASARKDVSIQDILIEALREWLERHT